MSVTQHDGSFDSGRNHLKPALVAVVLSAVIAALSFAFGGLPF